jgi:Zn-dependent protease with chaperone function
MTRTKYSSLVDKLSRRYDGRPSALRWITLFWAALGIGIFLLWFLLIGIIATLLVMVALRENQGSGSALILFFATGILFFGWWVVIRHFLVRRISAPTGVGLSPQEVPVLFQTMSALAAEIGAPMPHQVLLSAEMNASIVEQPRFGLVGWSRRYLIIGLPLLDTLSPDEFRAVLAHEFAHFSHQDGRVGHWLYRVRRVWGALVEDFNENSSSGGLFRKLLIAFFNWWWPRFNSRAFLLSRSQEYEADAVAARIVSRHALACSLRRFRVEGRWLSTELWKEIWQNANEQAEPVQGVMEQIRSRLRQGAPVDRAQVWADEGFTTLTTHGDTHPSLYDRLSALSKSFSEPSLLTDRQVLPPPPVTASNVYLGVADISLRTAVEKWWADDVALAWKQRHGRAQALRDLLDRSDSNSQGDADLGHLWDQALSLADLHDDLTAMPLIEKILSRQPAHHGALMIKGRHLLDESDPAGAKLLELVLAQPNPYQQQCASYLKEWYRRKGMTESLHKLDSRLDAEEEDLTAQIPARSNGEEAVFSLPHLSPETRQSILHSLQKIPCLDQAWLVQKSDTAESLPLFILSIRLRRSWYQLGRNNAEHQVARNLADELRLPGKFLVLPWTGSQSSLAKKAMAIHGSGLLDPR